MYTIYRIPSLRILDFKKVKERVSFIKKIILFFISNLTLNLKERQEANKLYKGKKLKQSDKPKILTQSELNNLTNTQQNNGFGVNNNESGNQQNIPPQYREQPSKEDIDAIRVIIQLNK